MALENIVGDLREYHRLQKGTFQHGDQLQAERQEKPELRGFWFYTADGHGYFLREDGGVDWAITHEADNLVLRHLDDSVNSSYDQLVHTGNYRPGNAEAAAARAARETVVVDMGKLRLSGNEEEYLYLPIRTEDGFILTEQGYQAPNEEEQKALARLGFTPATLRMLRDSDQKIGETRVYVLNPDYVKKNVDTEHNSLWRASWLDSCGGNSVFKANNRSVVDVDHLRGVLLEVAADASGLANGACERSDRGAPEMPGTTAKVNPVVAAYQIISARPEDAVTLMTPAFAAVVSHVLANYLKKQAE